MATEHVTHRDLDVLRAELRGEFALLRGEMNDMRGELLAEIAGQTSDDDLRLYRLDARVRGNRPRRRPARLTYGDAWGRATARTVMSNESPGESSWSNEKSTLSVTSTSTSSSVARTRPSRSARRST